MGSWSTRALVAPWHVESSQTKDQTNVPCIGRQILNHWTTRGSLVFFFSQYLFIWLCWVLVVAHRSFSCGMWDLVPGPGVEPGSLSLGVWSRSSWTSKEVPKYIYIETSGLMLHDSHLFSVLFNSLSYFATL